MARKTWISAVAAGAALIMTSPALAADAAKNGAVEATTSAASASNAAAAGAAKVDPSKKYCFMTEATGTRMQRKVCQTSDQWAADGINVERELKRARR